MPQDAGSVQEKDLVLPPGERSPSSSNVIYTRLTAAGLSELDKVARYVLAIGFSSEHAGDSREQLFIAQRTVAVAIHDGRLYVASNGLYWGEPNATQKGNVATALHASGVDEEIVYLANWAASYGLSPDDYHAEMQLVDYFHAMRLPLPELGVSKPCCSNCKKYLDQLAINYSYWHTQGTGKYYKAPKASAKWW